MRNNNPKKCHESVSCSSQGAERRTDDVDCCLLKQLAGTVTWEKGPCLSVELTTIMPGLAYEAMLDSVDDKLRSKIDTNVDLLQPLDVLLVNWLRQMLACFSNNPIRHNQPPTEGYSVRLLSSCLSCDLARSGKVTIRTGLNQHRRCSLWVLQLQPQCASTFIDQDPFARCKSAIGSVCQNKTHIKDHTKIRKFASTPESQEFLDS